MINSIKFGIIFGLSLLTCTSATLEHIRSFFNNGKVDENIAKVPKLLSDVLGNVPQISSFINKNKENLPNLITSHFNRARPANEYEQNEKYQDIQNPRGAATGFPNYSGYYGPNYNYNPHSPTPYTQPYLPIVSQGNPNIPYVVPILTQPGGQIMPSQGYNIPGQYIPPGAVQYNPQGGGQYIPQAGGQYNPQYIAQGSGQYAPQGGQFIAQVGGLRIPQGGQYIPYGGQSNGHGSQGYNIAQGGGQYYPQRGTQYTPQGGGQYIAQGGPQYIPQGEGHHIHQGNDQYNSKGDGQYNLPQGGGQYISQGGQYIPHDDDQSNTTQGERYTTEKDQNSPHKDPNKSTAADEYSPKTDVEMFNTNDSTNTIPLAPFMNPSPAKLINPAQAKLQKGIIINPDSPYYINIPDDTARDGIDPRR